MPGSNRDNPFFPFRTTFSRLFYVRPVSRTTDLSSLIFLDHFGRRSNDFDEKTNRSPIQARTYREIGRELNDRFSEAFVYENERFGRIRFPTIRVRYTVMMKNIERNVLKNLLQRIYACEVK